VWVIKHWINWRIYVAELETLLLIDCCQKDSLYLGTITFVSSCVGKSSCLSKRMRSCVTRLDVEDIKEQRRIHCAVISSFFFTLIPVGRDCVRKAFDRHTSRWGFLMSQGANIGSEVCESDWILDAVVLRCKLCRCSILKPYHLSKLFFLSTVAN
jgi:hypothetical protein